VQRNTLRSAIGEIANRGTSPIIQSTHNLACFLPKHVTPMYLLNSRTRWCSAEAEIVRAWKETQKFLIGFSNACTSTEKEELGVTISWKVCRNGGISIGSNCNHFICSEG
jgi:hypothetical protein